MLRSLLNPDCDDRLQPGSTITVILEPDADGIVHLALPEEFRRRKVRVEANLEAVEKTSTDRSKQRRFGALAGQVWMAPDFDAPLEDFKEYME